jgi:hypothetical protein
MSESPNRRYRQLSDSLVMLRDGALNDEGGRELNAAIAAVEATGKPAEVTLTLKIAPAAKNSEMVKVEGSVKAKIPQGDRAPSIFYVDKNHNLSREDPNAPVRGPLRDVSAGDATSVREVASGTH